MVDIACDVAARPPPAARRRLTCGSSSTEPAPSVASSAGACSSTATTSCSSPAASTAPADRRARADRRVAGGLGHAAGAGRRPPAELTFGPDDVVIVAVKSQDTAGVVDRPRRRARRRRRRSSACRTASPTRSPSSAASPPSHGVTVMAPTWHLEPGVVRAYTPDAAAILDIGRWPSASTTSPRPSPRRSGRRGSSRWPVPTSPAGSTPSCCSTWATRSTRCARATTTPGASHELARAEGEAVLAAAGIDHVSEADDRARRGDILRIVPIDDRPAAGRVDVAEPGARATRSRSTTSTARSSCSAGCTACRRRSTRCCSRRPTTPWRPARRPARSPRPPCWPAAERPARAVSSSSSSRRCRSGCRSRRSAVARHRHA